MITALTFAAAGFAVVQGSDALARRADAAVPPPVADLLPVSVTPLRLEEGYETAREFVGRIEPQQESTLSFEFGGRVTEILYDEGDHVERGAVVARIDTSLLEAEQARLEAVRDALEANLAFASLSVERRQALQERGFSPVEALDRARYDRDALTAQISETDAALRSVALQIEKSELLAPYGGTVGARNTDIGTSVASGAPILQLMMDEVANVRVGVPLWVEMDALDQARVQSGGRDYPAQLIAIRPDIDPDTRTRTALLSVEGTDLPFGATARISFPRQVDRDGAWVDIRSLREGAQGLWTVLVVDAEDRVRHLAVEVQVVQGDRAFVSGGFAPDLRLVEAGPQRIVPGQTVRPVNANTAETSPLTEGQ